MDSDRLKKELPECGIMGLACHTCPLSGDVETGEALLIWVGKQHYPTAEGFLKETRSMGVSRFIPAVPRGFELGTTWAFLAHVECAMQECPDCEGSGKVEEQGEIKSEEEVGLMKVLRVTSGMVEVDCGKCHGQGKRLGPGLFAFFKPHAVEYVVTGEETEEELAALESRGLTLVDVHRECEACQGSGSTTSGECGACGGEGHHRVE